MACCFICFPKFVSTAEKDKELFESKFSSSAEVIDSLKEHLQDLSSRLGAAEENIKSRKFLACFRHILLICFTGRTFGLKMIELLYMVYRNFSVVLFVEDFYT